MNSSLQLFHSDAHTDDAEDPYADYTYSWTCIRIITYENMPIQTYLKSYHQLMKNFR